jgi:hypothetical protein
MCARFKGKVSLHCKLYCVPFRPKFSYIGRNNRNNNWPQMLSPVHLFGWSQIANLITYVIVKCTKDNDKDEYENSKSLLISTPVLQGTR